MALLSTADLREELKHFASTAIREELAMLKASLLSELGAVECEQAEPCRKLVVEAKHGAAPGEDHVRSTGSHSRDAQLLPTHTADAKEAAVIRDMNASVRYMGLHGGAENDGRSNSRCSAFMNYCADIIHNHYFEMMSAWLVVMNAIWIGISTDWVARNWTTTVPDWFHYTDWVFCLLAVGELFIRIGAQGCAFFYEDHWRWNLFDTLVVVTQIADLVISVIERSVSEAASLRVLKLVRILRIARIASAFPELHILISSIIDSLQSLFWTMVLIFACLYGVAVVITQVVSDHKIAIGREVMEQRHEEMLHFFGSLDSTMVALYMVISEGIHWSELMNQLEETLGGWVRFLFVTFTGFELFAMMNIITACFVDSAMKVAAKAETKEVLDSLWGLLCENAGRDAHTDDKIVTREQFISTYGHESMRKFLDLINAHTEDPDHVFSMIDSPWEVPAEVGEDFAEDAVCDLCTSRDHEIPNERRDDGLHSCKAEVLEAPVFAEAAEVPSAGGCYVNMAPPCSTAGAALNIPVAHLPEEINPFSEEVEIRLFLDTDPMLIQVRSSRGYRAVLLPRSWTAPQYGYIGHLRRLRRMFELSSKASVLLFQRLLCSVDHEDAHLFQVGPLVMPIWILLSGRATIEDADAVDLLLLCEQECKATLCLTFALKSNVRRPKVCADDERKLMVHLDVLFSKKSANTLVRVQPLSRLVVDAQALVYVYEDLRISICALSSSLPVLWLEKLAEQLSVRSHSVKVTTLSWCAKVLQAIRRGQFQPDRTRSGRWVSAKQVVQTGGTAGDASSSSSSTEEDESDIKFTLMIMLVIAMMIVSMRLMLTLLGRQVVAAGGDGDGSLTAPEFLVCCERLMGPSKASMIVKIANEERERSLQQLKTCVSTSKYMKTSQFRWLEYTA
ncbi:Voltage-dependent P/Q-type calcium channel subunit alpha-1A [Symbiodinium microadriaticum]|uniref:Voltage-dependent P/Q-type calcium channel subunit alpha-1A n=1 Tax=Symbiodinium microadriaticum TaxID=2951 RepID=A0A1Q9DQS2_SYMMI|nr:Voltage-dependent P/Q-type calcium channel subunit alpha-1A [Symbiodinium microadriaticum]